MIRFVLLWVLSISGVLASYSGGKIKVFDEKVYPQSLITLGDNFARHALIIEKSTHLLHVFSKIDQEINYLHSYRIATGKEEGDKQREGDMRTPEGIYSLTKFLSMDDLVRRKGVDDSKIYGIGAFVTNYPNLMDVREGKTGGGIWIHSTDDRGRILEQLSSKGCTVLVDNDLVDLSNYIDLKKTIVITNKKINFLNKNEWKSQQDSFVSLISNWKTSWQEKKFDNYISNYHPLKFKNKKGDLKKYSEYKKSIFNKAEKPIIEFSDESIFRYDDYVLVQMTQKYTSNLVNGSGRKFLYLQPDENSLWKIVAEGWSNHQLKMDDYTPHLDFFSQFSCGEENCVKNAKK